MNLKKTLYYSKLLVKDSVTVNMQLDANHSQCDSCRKCHLVVNRNYSMANKSKTTHISEIQMEIPSPSYDFRKNLSLPSAK